MTTNPTDFYAIYSLLSDAERETLTRWRSAKEAEVAAIANDAWERGASRCCSCPSSAP